MVLALLTTLRFLLISFFGGRWCSFAQMGFSLERLTRPRNTRVTNLFIIALPLLQAWDLIVMPSRADLWNRRRGVHLRSAAEETWEEKTLAVCVIQGGRGARERAREKQTVRERERESQGGGGGCRQVLLLENHPGVVPVAAMPQTPCWWEYFGYSCDWQRVRAPSCIMHHDSLWGAVHVEKHTVSILPDA